MVLLIICPINLTFVQRQHGTSFNVACQPVFDNALKRHTKDSISIFSTVLDAIRWYRLRLMDELINTIQIPSSVSSANSYRRL